MFLRVFPDFSRVFQWFPRVSKFNVFFFFFPVVSQRISWVSVPIVLQGFLGCSWELFHGLS